MPVPWALPGAGNGTQGLAHPQPGAGSQLSRGRWDSPSPGISLCLGHGQAGVWIWLSRAGGWPCLDVAGLGLMAPGADMAGDGDSPAAQALSLAAWSGLPVGRACFRIHFYRSLCGWVFLKAVGGK